MLTRKRGYLSPELAIGWQVGRYVAECFDGLDEVMAAAVCDDDAVLALASLIGGNTESRVLVPGEARPWDFLFYHVPSGTRLAITLIRQRVSLPQSVRQVEAVLAPSNPELVFRYQACLDHLVVNLLRHPLTSYAMIRRARCRRLHSAGPDGRQVLCHNCGQTVPLYLAWDVEGGPCCASCCGLEPEWRALEEKRN